MRTVEYRMFGIKKGKKMEMYFRNMETNEDEVTFVEPVGDAATSDRMIREFIKKKKEEGIKAYFYFVPEKYYD